MWGRTEIRQEQTHTPYIHIDRKFKMKRVGRMLSYQLLQTEKLKCCLRNISFQLSLITNADLL